MKNRAIFTMWALVFVLALSALGQDTGAVLSKGTNAEAAAVVQSADAGEGTAKGAALPAFEIKTTVPVMKLPEKEVEQSKHGIMASFIDAVKTNLLKNNRWKYLTQGFTATIEIALFAVLLGITIGFVVAVIRCAHDQEGRMPVMNMLCKVYLTVVRGTPMVVQLLFIYFVVFAKFDMSKTLVAIYAFGFNSGAYVAEIIRGGINAIDKGQLEASRSLGLSYFQAMTYVILPQTFKNVLPALGNEFISLLKETSISGYIALLDLTKGGDIIRSQTYDAFLPLSLVALIYLAVVMLFTYLLGILERRLKKNER